MLAILTAALALVTADPTLTVESTTQTSEPVQAICTVKFPTNAQPVQAPCVVVAMAEGDVTGVAFAFGADSNIGFIGNAVETGVEVKVIMLGDTPYQAQGICVAEPGKVACVGAPAGSSTPLVVVAEY